MVALGLLLVRYAGHELTNEGKVPSDRSVLSAEAALRLARAHGVKREYLALMMEVPALTVRIKELEPWG